MHANLQRLSGKLEVPAPADLADHDDQFGSIVWLKFQILRLLAALFAFVHMMVRIAPVTAWLSNLTVNVSPAAKVSVEA